jgi:hypothetical protein
MKHAMNAIKTLCGMTALATGFFASAAAACTDAPVLERTTMSAAQWATASAVLQVETQDLKGSAGDFHAAQYPTASGTAELQCLYAETSVTCSNGVSVCALILFVDEGGAPRVVLDAAVNKAEVLPSTTNGWPDVALTAASSDGNVYTSVWSYGGDTYQEDSSVVTCSWSQNTCP